MLRHADTPEVQGLTREQHEPALVVIDQPTSSVTADMACDTRANGGDVGVSANIEAAASFAVNHSLQDSAADEDEAPSEQVISCHESSGRCLVSASVQVGDAVGSYTLHRHS